MNRRDLLALSFGTLFARFAHWGGEFEGQEGSRVNYSDNKVDAPDDYKNLAKDAPVIAMVIYEGFTVLDLIGPYQFLWAIMDHRVLIVAKKKGPVTSDTGIQVIADTSFADCPKEVAVLFVGGGTEGTLLAMKDAETREFIADRGKSARYVTSVCTGSLILAAAGLLKNKQATGHFAARDLLADFGAKPVNRRVVQDGKFITGAGVSAGLDLGLTVLGKIAGEPYAKQCQLFFEYDPQPPFDSGSVEKASKADVEMSMDMVKPFRDAVRLFAAEIKKE